MPVQSQPPDQPPPAGYGGNPVVQELLQQPGGRVAKSMRLIRRAVREGWAVDPELKKSLPEVIGNIALNSMTDRDRITATKVLVDMDKANLAAALELNKIERLDNGQPTEAVKHDLRITFDD